MARNGSGVYVPPVTSFSPAVSLTTMTASGWNTLRADIEQELTNSLDRLGRIAMAANLPMGGFRITGLGTPSLATDAATKSYVDTGVIPAGTIMLFAQASAPTGWTQVTSWNDVALRVVSGAGGGTTAGSVGFATAIGGNVGATAITVAQMPSHSHGLTQSPHSHQIDWNAGAAGGGAANSVVNGGTGAFQGNTRTSSITISVNNAGSGQTHTHTMPNIKYLNLITCSKN